MQIFALTVFLSSFLLFAVQPMIAKFLLPYFGGSAGVWATCMVFFQVSLLAGYAYAHVLRSRFSPGWQRIVHCLVLLLALLFLRQTPVLPDGEGVVEAPTVQLLRSLLFSVGFPFFALSATAPLIMEWFRQTMPGRAPDRLYAISNAGSLLALLGYPFMFEPTLTRVLQARAWAGGMLVFALLCAFVAWKSRAASPPFQPVQPIRQPASQVPGALLPAWLWVVLPALGSALLLAITNQMSQDVAPTPLLWIAPMTVYLLTFILCFESQRFYRRGLFIAALIPAFLFLAWLLHEGYLQTFWVQIGGYLSVLFIGCMICHGELYRLRPHPEKLTAYYLGISLGGAIGGSFVALAAPAIFKTILETPILALAIPSLVTLILWREKRLQFFGRPAWQICLAGAVVLAGALLYVGYNQRKQAIFFARSFYGAYNVKEGPTLLLDKINYILSPGPARVLASGQIYHGLQFTGPEAARRPTTYYSEESGLALALKEARRGGALHVGAIGLGVGTSCAYLQPGDKIRFYELNPQVSHIARSYFSFVSNCAAEVEIVLGDGRLSLEREDPQDFDLLVLDAFSGDSIPIHLLTSEAMAIYKKHVKQGGLLAAHISNSHLDLEPVVLALAEKHGFRAVLVPPQMLDPRQGKLPSIWMLLSTDPDFFSRPAISQLRENVEVSSRRPLLWTDDHSSILPILK